jgi:hypothetical protein
MNSDLSDAGGGFDELAEEFDRTRPVCPGELFDDLMALGGLSQSRCRIGCGIGQATVPLAERGLSVSTWPPSLEVVGSASRGAAISFPESALASAHGLV